MKKLGLCKHKKHGVKDCSDCRLDIKYGSPNNEREEPRDLTDDLKVRAGYKLTKAHYMKEYDRNGADS